MYIIIYNYISIYIYIFIYIYTPNTCAAPHERTNNPDFTGTAKACSQKRSLAAAGERNHNNNSIINTNNDNNNNNTNNSLINTITIIHTLMIIIIIINPFTCATTTGPSGLLASRLDSYCTWGLHLDGVMPRNKNKKSRSPL